MKVMSMIQWFCDFLGSGKVNAKEITFDIADVVWVVAGFIAFSAAVSHTWNLLVSLALLGIIWLGSSKWPFLLWFLARGTDAMLFTALLYALVIGVIQTLGVLLTGEIGASPSAVFWQFHSFSKGIDERLWGYYPVSYHIVWALILLKRVRF
jgi:hypothetical protein